MNYLLSVIIPVYNVEHYLDRCLTSIINQTYSKLEIILVNDGSTDASKDICLAYAKKDTRIIIIDQENSGSSIARNTGLEKATGDVISFIDSDDHIEVTMFEKMLQLMNEHHLKVVEIESRRTTDQKVFDHAFIIENALTATKRIITNTNFAVWRRIYKKSLIEDMRFIPKIIHQDVFFTIDVLNRVSSVGYLNNPLYIYNTESVGIIRSKYSAMKRDIAIKATEYIVANVPQDAALKKIVNNYVANYYTDHYFLLSRNISLDSKKDYRAKLRREIIKAISFSNIKLRSFLIVLLPMKVIELISSANQSLKK